MRTLIKEHEAHDLRPVSAEAGWQMFMPQMADDEGAADLTGMRVALRQAEIVIHAQEERIRNLEEMALTDELTGLANRRAFGIAFERELALARRDTNCSGILVMIDLDGFKGINDRWGHQAGDDYLCAVAEVLRDELRASDVVARLGGDEFALLLTQMDERSGAKRLATLEENFCKRAIMLSERIPLCASFGFASYVGFDSVESVMRIADQRLYANKKKGRGAV